MSLSVPVAVLALLNVAFVALLPKIFFRSDGTFNLRWMLTAAPYVLNPVFLILNMEHVTIWHPVSIGLPHERLILETVAVPLFAASIALIAFTIGIHRVPLALWHQENDAPQSIVTHGPYAWVRHPFYTAFLICLAACVVACPHPATLAVLIYTQIALSLTARREERRLSASDYGEEYRAYMKKTGRFFPGFGRAS